MSRSSSADLVAEIRVLPDLPLHVLKERWRRLYRTEPPKRISRNLLVRALAYRIQEKAFGGLKPAIRRRLRSIASNQAPREASALDSVRIKPGTRLIRVWQGETHQVTVLDKGFEWRSRRYRSLSEVARAITGTRWSGPVFFGLKPLRGSRQAAVASEKVDA